MLVRLGRGTDGDGVSFVCLSTLHNNFVYMHQEKEVTERDVKEKKLPACGSHVTRCETQTLMPKQRTLSNTPLTANI